MFDIEACYKIIFEALFEQEGSDNIVRKVHEYTNAFVYLVLMSGEILSFACAENEKKTASIQNKHITLSDYERIQVNIRKTEHSLYSEKWGYYYHIAEFEVGGKKIGNSILVYDEEDQKENMEKVNEILCLALGIQFKDIKTEVYENIIMRRQICAWTIFSEEIHKSDNLKLLEQDVVGKYFLAYIPCKSTEMNKQKIFQQIHAIWGNSFYDFHEDSMSVLFWGNDEMSRLSIVAELQKLGYPICVSELFDSLRSCIPKLAFLMRMDVLKGYQKTEGVMEEKKWYVETVFSYAETMFSEAGFQDYFIEQLCKMDEEKNLELYDTLKKYLLCENNISVTASKLHVHRNTLVYRLKQIQNCIDRNINDSNVSKELLSYMIMYDIARQNGE